MDTIPEESLNTEEKQNIALLLWKCITEKAGFAQDFNAFLCDKLETEGNRKFTLPQYLQDAINHLLS